MNIAIIGTGYIGLVQGVVMSDLGFDVVCIDNDEVKINEENNLKKELEELNKNLENIANIKFISPFSVKDYLVILLKQEKNNHYILFDYINTINDFFKDTGKEIYLYEDETELRIKPIRYLNNLKLEDLSSGEMELLILLTKIYFSFNQNSIIIFDEPEKSLHIEWQIFQKIFRKA